jgi:hypothetical protein
LRLIDLAAHKGMAAPRARVSVTCHSVCRVLCVRARRARHAHDCSVCVCEYVRKPVRACVRARACRGRRGSSPKLLQMRTAVPPCQPAPPPSVGVCARAQVLFPAVVRGCGSASACAAGLRRCRPSGARGTALLFCLRRKVQPLPPAEPRTLVRTGARCDARRCAFTCAVCALRADFYILQAAFYMLHLACCLRLHGCMVHAEGGASGRLRCSRAHARICT